MFDYNLHFYNKYSLDDNIYSQLSMINIFPQQTRDFQQIQNKIQQIYCKKVNDKNLSRLFIYFWNVISSLYQFYTNCKLIDELNQIDLTYETKIKNQSSQLETFVNNIIQFCHNELAYSEQFYKESSVTADQMVYQNQIQYFRLYCFCNYYHSNHKTITKQSQDRFNNLNQEFEMLKLITFQLQELIIKIGDDELINSKFCIVLNIYIMFKYFNQKQIPKYYEENEQKLYANQKDIQIIKESFMQYFNNQEKIFNQKDPTNFLKQVSHYENLYFLMNSDDQDVFEDIKLFNIQKVIKIEKLLKKVDRIDHESVQNWDQQEPIVNSQEENKISQFQKDVDDAIDYIYEQEYMKDLEEIFQVEMLGIKSHDEFRKAYNKNKVINRQSMKVFYQLFVY